MQASLLMWRWFNTSAPSRRHVRQSLVPVRKMIKKTVIPQMDYNRACWLRVRGIIDVCGGGGGVAVHWLDVTDAQRKHSPPRRHCSPVAASGPVR